MSEDEFDLLTENRSLCTADGELQPIHFESVVRLQLNKYCQVQSDSAILILLYTMLALLRTSMRMILAESNREKHGDEPRKSCAESCHAFCT